MKQFELLRELLNRSDVTEVINARDAGREGELIFRTVYYLSMHETDEAALDFFDGGQRDSD